MKANIKLITLGLAAVVGLGLTSCSDEETYDVRGANHNLVYVSNTVARVANCQIFTTPAGVFGDITASVPVRLQYNAESTVKVSAVVDTTLTSQYNNENGTNALAVPQDVAAGIEVTAAEIQKDTTMAKENLKVTLPENLKAKLTQPEYVLPIRLTIESGSGNRQLASSEDLGVYYIAIHNSHKLASLSNTENTSTITLTPKGVSGSINVKYGVSLKRAIDSNVSASLSPATNLVSDYNTAHATSYKALPADIVSALSIANATVEAGKTSAEISVSSEKADFSSLDVGTYLLPMKFNTTYSNNASNEAEENVAYLIVNVEESLIDDNPSAVTGKTVTDISAWKCLAADNFDPSNMTTSKWVPKAKKGTCEFTIDFGAVHNVTGFMKPYCYIGCNGIKVSLSEDGNSWSATGSISGKNTAKDANGKDCYVFYRAIKARYAKVTIYLDEGSYIWNYLPYDWAKDYVGIDWNMVFND